MSLHHTLFPEESRSFPGMRWVNIGLRTLHLIGLAGIGGAWLNPAQPVAWLPYVWLTLLSGGGLMGLSLYSNGIWLLQLRGMVILFKLVLLLLMIFIPQTSLAVVITVIVLSSVIAHAPGNLRYFSPWHRRRIERLTGHRTP